MRIKFLFAFLLVSMALFAQQNPIQIDSNGLTQTLTAGAIVNRGQIVKINSAGQVVPMLTTDTSGAIGVAATAQQNTGGSIAVSIAGTPLIQIDSGGCTAGNIVSISNTTAGAGHCASTASGQQIGIALSVSSPGSNFWNIQLASSGGGSPVQGVPGPVFNVKDPKYGAIGDAKSTRDCVATINTTTWTSASNPWTAADVGKFAYNSQGYGNPTFTPTKITGFNSAGSITVAATAAGSGTGTCVWFTQKDTAAFTSALSAAQAALTAGDLQNGGPNLNYPGTVYCPPGGYVVDGPFFNQNLAAGNTNAVSFTGSGRNSCMIYVSPDMTSAGNAYLGYIHNASNFRMSGFSLSGSQMLFPSNLPFFQFNNDSNYRLEDFNLYGLQANGASGDSTFGTLYLTQGTQVTIDTSSIISGAGTGAQLGFHCISVGQFHARNLLISNDGINAQISCGSRGPNAQPSLWEASIIDECGVPPCMRVGVDAATTMNFSGLSVYGENATLTTSGALYVTNNSTLYCNSCDIGAFNSNLNSNAVRIDSGSSLFLNNSTCRGNGTGACANGPAGGTFVDVGGNTWQNCSGLTCNPVTAAQYATLGFTGGIVPTSSIQMPSNTCYPVQGNLLATAQNLCSFVLTKNQQITSLSAQSGGTTPANSSCATPPVITVSDGTRSATMTMTTGKTFWTSGIDVNTNVPGQVFASGATLTVSIGANTCATPPANVSVTYNLQSVLNP